VLGMNFDAPFFKTQAVGFWSAVGAMLLIAGGSLILAKHRRWI
jgi:Mg2+ and Co2+ transporter CorA